jgi:hypothetical protein
VVPREGAPNILLIKIETVRELSHEKTRAGFARADSTLGTGAFAQEMRYDELANQPLPAAFSRRTRLRC